jgi:GNAT superfamily N-acetyltransferase
MLFAIKPLTCLHYRSAKDIFEETFDSQEYPEFNLSWRLRSKTESIGIFTSQGDLIGFALIWGSSRMLKYLSIHPMFQRFKLGTRLLTAILDHCRSVKKNLYLVPAQSPHVAQWYTKHGFAVSKYFKASDGTTWPYMNFHPYSTRSKAKALSVDAVSKYNERAAPNPRNRELSCIQCIDGA